MAGFSVPIVTFFYNGQVAASGSVYVYQTGTTTPVTVYSDSGLTTPITNPINLDQNGQAVFYVAGTTNLKLVAYNGLGGAGILINTIDPIFPVSGTTAASTTVPWVVAGGSANAITATYSPVITTLTDGLLLSFRAIAANTTTNPTFAPNGLTALTITQKGGSALSAGNIAAANAEYFVRYNLANTRWELMNPSIGSTVIVSVKRQVFNASGTYTPSTGMLYCDAEVWGAGGGGGGCTATAGSVGAGGGAGGYSKKVITAATIGASQTVTIGAAGTVGANTGGTGGTGGTTSLAAIITATGGSGGQGSAASNPQQGGAGGVGASGDDNQTGNPGQWVSSGLATGENSGSGGSTSRGGAGAGQNYVGDSAGKAAVANSGSGGGGGAANGTAHTGGLGGSGCVIVTEYCSQ